MPGKSDHGSWTPDWPEELFMLYPVFRNATGSRQVMLPLTMTTRSREDIPPSIVKVEKLLRRRLPGGRVSFFLVISLRLSGTWPLKPEYWQPTRDRLADYTDTRQKVFMDLVNHWEDQPWQVIVTPGKPGKIQAYHAGFAAPKAKIHVDGEAFMAYSDWFVPPQAAEAGIYDAVQVSGVPWNFKPVRI